MKRALTLIALQCCLLEARGESLPRIFCDDFSSGIGEWEIPLGCGGVWWPSTGDTTNPLDTTNPVVMIAGSDAGGCFLGRRFEDVEGWILLRYLYAGTEYYLVPYPKGMLGIEFLESTGDTLRTLSSSPNIRPALNGDLAIGCTVHRFAGRDAVIRFYKEASGRLAYVDNVALFRIPDSCALAPSAYLHDITIEKDTAAWPDDTLYTLTYSGIPVSDSFLLFHLSIIDPERRKPYVVTINGQRVFSGVAGYSDNDELSFAWRPGTDTASITLWPVKDSVAFTAEELTMFCVSDIDTLGCDASPVHRTEASPARLPAGIAGSAALFDIQGRRVSSRSMTPSSTAPGIYVQPAAAGRRGRMIAVGGR